MSPSQFGVEVCMDHNTLVDIFCTLNSTTPVQSAVHVDVASRALARQIKKIWGDAAEPAYI